MCSHAPARPQTHIMQTWPSSRYGHSGLYIMWRFRPFRLRFRPGPALRFALHRNSFVVALVALRSALSLGSRHVSTPAPLPGVISHNKCAQKVNSGKHDVRKGAHFHSNIIPFDRRRSSLGPKVLPHPRPRESRRPPGPLRQAGLPRFADKKGLPLPPKRTGPRA